jgi:hypothetical protein
MTARDYHLVILIEIGILAFQLRVGRAAGWRWEPLVRREDQPRAYWTLMALHGVFFVALLKYGRTW